ncbi:hypothetical protein GCM10010837_32550 [Aminobacter niigataensis]
MGADLVAKHGTVAYGRKEAIALSIELAQRLAPEKIIVTDDEEFARLLEEGVEIINDHEVEVEEKCRALQVGQIAAEKSELAPTSVLSAGGQVQSGERQRLDIFVQPGGIVREADEAMRTLQMLSDAAAQIVDVFRAVERSPFYADHIDCIVQT